MHQDSMLLHILFVFVRLLMRRDNHQRIICRKLNILGPIINVIVSVKANDMSIPPSSIGCRNIPGDANDNGAVNILDNTFQIAYLYKGGSTPTCTDKADAKGADSANILEITYLINYLNKGGLALPCIEEGDANGGGAANILYITYLMAFRYEKGRLQCASKYCGYLIRQGAALKTVPNKI